jgi:hypothetical protein
MRFEPIEPPREFAVGDIRLRHVADVELGENEVATFKTPSGTELDVTRKDWGYYATGSFNSRLASFGLRAALARNSDGRMSLLLIERGHEDDFEAYADANGMRVVAWLDSDEAVEDAARRLEG